MDSPQTPEATQYALRVALQTMKERCQVLQKRLNALEDENQHLRANRNELTTTLPTTTGFAAENFQLRLQLETTKQELQNTKTQLSEQINMVSNENRTLWSRLSQMAKEQSGKSADCTLTNNSSRDLRDLRNSNQTGTTGANQNLIRSKTFTQHSPNPNLRHKLITSNDDSCSSNQVAVDMKDLSLEEVALGAGEEMATPADAELGFSYLNMDESNYIESINASESDFQMEAKKCAETVQHLRSEALQQQQELQGALAALKQKIAKRPCLECMRKQKTEMADKSLETDESLHEVLETAIEASALNTITNQHNINTNASLIATTTTTTATTTPHINFIEDKIDADNVIKRCPMCGKIYNESITFRNFCEHVESHFSDETSDLGSMLEHDFECISNTIGNF